MSEVGQLAAEIARLHAELAQRHAELAQLKQAHAQELAAEKSRFAAREAELLQLVGHLNRQTRQLRRQAWGKKSERSGRKKPTAVTPGRPPKKTSEQFRARMKPGPKPFDPALPRVKIKLPDPEPKARLCPLTGELMQPGFTETIEVLQFVPAQVVVQVLERTVFVSAAKSAPVYTPWPDDVLARQRVHASVLAHLAAEHYSEHQPFNRMEKKLDDIRKRAGIETTIHVAAGEVADRVRAEAERFNSDLLVIGRGVLHEKLGRLRTHAHSIIRHAPCPVISI